MKQLLSVVFFSMAFLQVVFAQNTKNSIKYNLNDSGTTYIQLTLLNQTWLRFNQSNSGTLVQNSPKDNTFDIGLRRTRMQILGQLSPRVFLYFQYGMNNFNSMYNSNNGNRKLSAFFHDAVCEYRLSPKNELKIGAGLTIANGLSRFSQPSIGTIMTMDVPVFAQTTVDQIDEFSRKLSIYARGQIWKIDYRFVLSDPFPINSSGASLPVITKFANFSQKGHQLQGQAYLIYQFFEHEPHTTPYMTGTYLGNKKIFNIAIGAIYQPNAMWKLSDTGDTLYQPMRHLAAEAFLDIPLNKENKSAISAYVGYFNLFYGSDYLRYNGIMNPANATALNTTSGAISGQGPIYGNSYPMFGTGQTICAQFGYLLPKQVTKGVGKLMPYVSATISKYTYLDGLWTNVFNGGINYFINEHKSKITIDWQNRPTYSMVSGAASNNGRKNSITIQYQIFF